MADVKLSQLIAFTPVLSDEVIVNDVSSLTTKRSTLQDIRNLANTNIDDVAGGSQVDGNLSASGSITGTTDITFSNTLTDGFGNSITNLDELVADSKEIDAVDNQTLTEGYLIFRENATGFDSSYTSTGLRYDTTGDLATLSAPAFSGNGAELIKVDSAYHSQITDLADQVNIQDPILNSITDTLYATFSTTKAGASVLYVDSDLRHDPATNQFGGPDIFFVGDGSLLENVGGKQIQANLTEENADHSVLFRLDTTAETYDSTNIDTAFLYNPGTNIIKGTTETELFLFGGSQWTKKTDSIIRDPLLAEPVKDYVTGKASTTGYDSVGIHEHFYVEGDTVYATKFSGNGSELTNLSLSIANEVKVVNADANNGTSYIHFGSASGAPADEVNASSNLRYVPDISKINNISNTGAMYFGADSDVGISVSTGVAYSFNMTNNGSSAYTFSDAGNVWFPSAEDNPVLYLRRGDTYRFDHNHTGHPFLITEADTSTPYTTGVSVISGTDEVGITQFKVPMSAPSSLYYKCTNHGGMANTITVV